MENKYLEAFFKETETEESWKNIIRQISAFLLYKRLNEKSFKISTKLMFMIDKLEKPSEITIIEDFVKVEEDKESVEIMKDILKSFDEVIKINKNNFNIDLNLILKLLEFDYLFEIIESERTIGYKYKIIKEKFVIIQNELKGEEAFNKLEEHFKSTLKELHFERYSYKFKYFSPEYFFFLFIYFFIFLLNTIF